MYFEVCLAWYFNGLADRRLRRLRHIVNLTAAADPLAKGTLYSSLTQTPTVNSALEGPTKAPVTGETISGWSATATAMCLAPAISPLVGSKPFQPAPGRYTSAQAWVEPLPPSLRGAFR